MDQLKVKDRILENISLSVKKVRPLALVWIFLRYCQASKLEIPHMFESLQWTIGHLVSAKRTTLQSGGHDQLAVEGPAFAHIRQTDQLQLFVYACITAQAFRWSLVSVLVGVSLSTVNNSSNLCSHTAACLVNTLAVIPRTNPQQNAQPSGTWSKFQQKTKSVLE